MALTAGTRLGPYEISTLIGAGGMGEVYQAKDPRLGREVAVKILPQQFSADSDRLRRFEQEARAAGMLNHPNILTIFDIGTQDGSIYVVSELLVGETLRERMGGSPLQARKAVEYALQISHGLAAAHEKGIVHRDLKPENIYLTRDGRVKILDFGLAKLTEPQPVAGEQSRLQTIDPGTQPGMVLGAVGYMSPEQVRGRVADHRSDIFTFGAILYEMLTGKRAFHRDSTADTMSAILKEDPPELSSTNKNIPPALDRVIRHCLEKNAEERFQSARDLAFDLEMISGVSGTTAEQAVIAPVHDKHLLRKMILALIILTALGIGFVLGRRTGSTPSQKPRAAVSSLTFKRLTFRRGSISSARFSPDGQSMIYSAAWGGTPDEIFTTRPQSPVSRSLGLQNALLLSISSSGEMAVLLNPRFYSGWERRGTLARVPIDGGAPREVLEDLQDADWAPNGKDLAVAHFDSGKYRLEFPAGKVLYETDGWLNYVRVSRKGNLVAFLDHPTRGDDRGTVAVVDLNGKKRDLTQDWASESGLAWSKDGKEIWFSASKEGSNEQPLYAVTLSGQMRVVSAMAGNLILQDVFANGDVLLARDSRRREMIVLPPGETRERDLSWFDWSFCRAMSADGETILFEEQGAGGGPNYSVYLRKTDGSPAIKLGEGYGMALSPDGNWVLSRLPSDFSRVTLLPTGAGESKTISLPGIKFGSNFLPFFQDDKRLVLPGNQIGRPPRLWSYHLETNTLKPVTPEGITGPDLITPDRTGILAPFQEGFAIYPIEGGEPRKLPGLVNDKEFPMQWTAEGRAIYVGQGHQIPARIYRVDAATGQRTLYKEIIPPDPAGISGNINMLITPDGKSYAYTYRRVLSDLYLVEGLH